MTPKVLYVLNLSTLVNDADVRAMVTACDHQIRAHVAPSWGKAPMRVAFQPGKMLPTGSAYIAVVDDDQQLTGALGAHWESPAGWPVGEILASWILNPPDQGGAGGAPLTGPVSVASVLSHEVIELFVDPTVNAWADAPDGFEYRQEACDPVESDSYSMPGSVVTLSNFVLPAWLDDSPPAAAKTDWLNTLGGQAFAIASGGYVERRTSSSDETSVQARRREKVFGVEKTLEPGPDYPAWRLAMRGALAASPYSRASRRTKNREELIAMARDKREHHYRESSTYGTPKPGAGTGAAAAQATASARGEAAPAGRAQNENVRPSLPQSGTAAERANPRFRPLKHNRVPGDPGGLVTLPVAGTVNADLRKDFYVTNPGMHTGAPAVTLQLPGVLAGGTPPAEGDEFTVSDDSNVLSSGEGAHELAIVGKASERGAQIVDGGAAADSITLSAAGAYRRLVFGGGVWHAISRSAS